MKRTEKSLQVGKLLWLAFALAIFACPSSAQLNGFNIKGDMGSMAGTQAPEGMYVGAPFYWYDTSRINNSSGTQVNPGGSLDMFIRGPVFSWVTPLKLFGANYGFTVALPIASTALEAPKSSGFAGHLVVTNDLAPGTTFGVESAEGSASKDEGPQPSNSAQSNSSSDDAKWHITAAPYLWFPGVHGTVGAAGRQVSIHASPGDLLSNFKFGLMGAVELRYKRLVIPMDMMWVRLEDDHPLPLEAVTSAKFTGGQFFLTPKIGYRVIDEEKIKLTALTGFRYWHLYESVKFNPVGLSFSNSQDWAAPLVGGRIELMPAPKVVVTVFGDVGGWGAGSQLEYQVAGLLGYKIKPTWTLQAGYRYLSVDYRSGGFLFNVITSGAVAGITINLK